MGKRFTAIFIFVCALCAAFCSAQEKEITIAVVKSNDNAPYSAAVEGVKKYFKKKSVAAKLTEYNLDGKGKEQFQSYYSAIQSSNPDIILALGTSAAKSAQEIVKNTPVIFAMALYPSKSGIKISGVSMDISADLKLKKLRELIPPLKTIGVIYSSKSSDIFDEITAAAERNKFEIVGKKIDSAKDFTAALGELSGRIDSFMMIADPSIYFPQAVDYLLRESLNKKFPVIGLSSKYTKAGALISFDCDYGKLGEQAAELAISTIDDDPPAEPVFIAPKTVNFSLNFAVDERMDIDLPQETERLAAETFGENLDH